MSDKNETPPGVNGKPPTKGEEGATAGAILLSPLTMLLVLVGSMSLAFGLGRHLGSQGIVSFPPRVGQNPPKQQQEDKLDPVALPDPPLISGKVVPNNRYTSMYFDYGGVKVRSSSALLKDDAAMNECFIDEYGNQDCSGGSNLTDEKEMPATTKPEQVVAVSAKEQTDGEEEEIHEPAGQHLLIDIENVQAEFLNDEVRLAQAMIDVVGQSELTLLSYHCHGLVPAGVSCVGVLLESHVSFHTWPDEGVITLDLFTCGPKSLLPLVNVMYKLFGVPRETSEEEPHMIWSHKKRGFRYNGSTAVRTDLDRFLGDVELKKEEVVSAVTEMQEIHVYDVIEPRFRSLESYHNSLLKDGSTYESLHPEFFQMDRLVFLDGALQSRRYGEAAYHEALVHPAMITHEDPKRVVIIGGGPGAVLREVLKHNTVEHVLMLEVDETVTQISKEYLPEWSDCKNLVGGSKSCFDDPRVEMYHLDAVDWFLEKFGGEAEISSSDQFDVVVIDAFDPDSELERTNDIFGNTEFVEALRRSLSGEGVVAVQVGESGTLYSENSSSGAIGEFIEDLDDVEFESVMEYEEMHGRLTSPWRYLVAMKDRLSRTRWMASESEMSFFLQQRIVRNVDGELSLRHFDAASMMTYTFPSRVSEARFCGHHPGECTEAAFDPDRTNHPISSFEVKASTVGGGRGVFTRTEIAEGDYLALSDAVHSMFVPPLTQDVLYQGLEILSVEGDLWHVLTRGYVEGYGVEDSFYGEPATFVDPGIFTFANHGCGGTYNIGTRTNRTESTVNVGDPVATIYDDRNDPYNPYHERQYLSIDVSGSLVALRDIHAGEELLDNYVIFGGGADQEDFDENIADLQNICAGGDGLVTSYEEKSEQAERQSV